jgi:hypothetical protein
VSVGVKRLELFDFGRKFLGSGGGDVDFGSVGKRAGSDCKAQPRGTANDESAAVQKEVWVGHCEIEGWIYTTNAAVLIFSKS